MDNKLLIAVGTAHYKNLAEHEQCPQLTDIVNSLVEYFTRSLSYTRVLAEVGDNPTSHELRFKLDTWFASKDRDISD
jgi:hypothetical protein